MVLFGIKNNQDLTTKRMKQNEFGIGERDLLYKLWHKKRKSFVDIDLRISLMDGNGIEAEYDLNDVVFCQYAGRKDKNGNKIFEGNIVKDGKRVYVVKYFSNITWDSGGSPHPGFYLWNRGSFCYDNDNDIELEYGDGFDDVEVIGHILENPELIPE